ncbi:hypothetical protein BDZ45DRAFT_800523 [Acephala macrosclerotiorum]|nr:hypothetical protein BDZ45DRAFT_800523 [Acephala macrosclerotiorum]
MARLPGRSRGCRICRQRRIKCDLKVPECTQCKRNKKKCPGPITGTFYIVASETPQDFSNLDDNSQGEPLVTELPIVESMDGPVLKGELIPTNANCLFTDSEPKCFLRPTSEDISELSYIASESQSTASLMPTTYQPSRAEPFEQLFFSHFFETSGRGIETMGSCSWLSKLPGLIVSSFDSKAIRYSARATCMAFYSTLNGELSVWNEAYRTYVRALRSQRGEISPTQNPHTKSSFPSEEAVCTSIMMFYFEMVTQSTPWAWVNHMDAAAAMLEMRGPENCRSRFIYQLFRTARLGATFTSVMRRRPHAFAQREWQAITPEHTMTELDILVDVFLSIPGYIKMHDELYGGLSKVLPHYTRTAILKLTRGVASLLSQLNTETKFCLDDLDSTVGDENRSPQKLLFRKRPSFESMSEHLSALRNAAYVICLSLMAEHDHTGNWLEQAISRSAEVLSAVDSVDSASKSHASRMFITTVFPTYVVAIWSPSEKYRALATNRLQHSTPVL